MNPILPADLDPVLDADTFSTAYRSPTTRWASRRSAPYKENARGTIVRGPAVALTRGGARHPRRIWADRDSFGRPTSTSSR